MSTTTDKLALFKYDPSTDGAQTFNIKQALNDNWDKLDDAVKAILITLANKAPGTHAGQHAAGGSDPITPTAIGAVGYDAEQSLSYKEKGQARGNISALNGQFLFAGSVGGKIGWYRITKPFSYYSADGYLTVSHAWANGGASELLLGVSSTPDTHGKLQCLRGIGQINSVPYISNARLVKVDRSTFALDLYVSGTGTNDWDLQLCNCGHNLIELISPTFISTDDTLPSGETLAAVVEYQNPPMLLGVEYKTMERYLGKPVYVKAVGCGSCPASGYKDVVYGDAGIVLPIRCEGTWSYSDRSTIPFESSNDDQLHIGALGNKIRVKTGGKDFSSYKCTATVYYAKDTD